MFQIAYQLVLLYVIVNHKPSNNNVTENPPSVSVVICAKNETINLQQNLPSILQQNYPDFEVIVVDDGSDERLTMNPATSSGQANGRLTIIHLSKDEKIGLGKKHALQTGIEAAKNELILLTDADCKPLSENWMAEMAGCVNEQYKIVLGISPYKTEDTFLNALIEYETAQTALQYSGFALLGNPYMSVGRNVLYDANLLKSKKWSDIELSIASGDDDLAIQTLATGENTTVCLTTNSFTYSDAKKNWKDFIKQKWRHYESGNLYKISHRILLGSYLLSKLLLYGCLIYLLMSGTYEKNLPFGFLSFYLITITLCNLNLNYHLRLNKRWYFSFLNDLLYCIFTITLGLASQIKPAKNWK